MVNVTNNNLDQVYYYSLTEQCSSGCHCFLLAIQPLLQQ